MANQPVSANSLPTATTIKSTDRIVFIYNAANASSWSLRTISANNFLRNIGNSIPTYANNAAANAALGVDAVYKTEDGELRVVV